MGTEIFKFDASWDEKLTKTRVSFLMTPSVDSQNASGNCLLSLYECYEHERHFGHFSIVSTWCNNELISFMNVIVTMSQFCHGGFVLSCFYLGFITINIFGCYQMYPE